MEICISIIISTWSRKDHLIKLVDSLVSQSTGIKYEIIIVDSNSPDGSEELINQRYMSPGFTKNINVSYHNTVNSLSAKRNYGARHAEYSYLVFLDDDMLVHTDTYIDAVSEAIKTHDMESTIISGHVSFPPQLLNNSYFMYKNSKHAWSDGLENYSQIPSGKFIAMNFLIKKDIYFILNGFDESFQHYGGEDRDFEFKSIDKGLKHLISTKMVAYHCEGGGSISNLYNKIKTNSEYGFSNIVKKYGVERFGRKIQFVEKIYSAINRNIITRSFGHIAIKLLSKPIYLSLDILNKSSMRIYLLFDIYYLLAHLDGALNRGANRNKSSFL